jgi:hypothetical protein
MSEMSLPIPPLPDGASSTVGGPSEETKHLAYGEAALMLIECLMLTLVEQRVLTMEELVDAVELAGATKRKMVEDGEHPQISAVAAGLLSTLANSLAAREVRRF